MTIKHQIFVIFQSTLPHRYSKVAVHCSSSVHVHLCPFQRLFFWRHQLPQIFVKKGHSSFLQSLPVIMLVPFRHFHQCPAVVSPMPHFVPMQISFQRQFRGVPLTQRGVDNGFLPRMLRHRVLTWPTRTKVDKENKEYKENKKNKKKKSS